MQVCLSDSRASTVIGKIIYVQVEGRELPFSVHISSSTSCLFSDFFRQCRHRKGFSTRVDFLDEADDKDIMESTAFGAVSGMFGELIFIHYLI